MPSTVLPDPSRLRLDLLRVDGSTIIVLMATTPARSSCPLCGLASARVHSRYVRTLADLPWHGVAVSVQLTVRRFVCTNADCTRRIFGERLPGIVAPYARRTVRLYEALELIGFALGGEAGARVLRQLAMTGSPGTLWVSLLRTIRAASLAEHTDPRILGVDDFAFRRGHRYGTILVDLERRCVIDLLPDRTPDTFTAWLERHASPEIISRDRGGGYARAARCGAPDAIQVADRFHLLKNLTETLETLFLRHRSALKEAAATTAAERPPPKDGDVPHDEMYQGKRKSPQNWQQRAEEARVAKHAARVARSEQVRTLYEKGAEIADIARRLEMSRRTVYRYVRMDGPPECRRPGKRPGTRVLTPYEPYILERWKEGCHNGTKLWREIKEQGFAYSVTNVYRFVAHLRREGKPPPGRSAHGGRMCQGQGPTARHVAILAIQRVERLDEEETAYLSHLRSQDTMIETACRLSQEFAAMLRGRTGDRLDAWIEAVKTSGIDDLIRFAASLLADEAPVRAGLTLAWSNGQVEGHVNRLKLIKRQMYGRANFDLLRQRVLHAA
ncbi:MAG: ISL3 family transposase [Chloroflexota bacterium]